MKRCHPLIKCLVGAGHRVGACYNDGRLTRPSFMNDRNHRKQIRPPLNPQRNIKKMTEIKTPPTWDDIRTKLASTNITDRNLAHWFMQDDANASYLPLLHEVALIEDENEAHFSAAAGIARVEGFSQYNYLIETMAEAYAKAAGEHSAPLDSFIDALQEVSDNHPLPVAGILTELLHHQRASVRAFAAFLFGMSEVSSPASLLTTLKDPDPLVRVSAVSAASAFGADPSVVPALLHLLEDSSEEVRVMVAYVLADLRAPQSLPALQRAAKEDPAKTVRQASAHAIRRIKGTDRWLWWGLIALVAVACAVLVQLAI